MKNIATVLIVLLTIIPYLTSQHSAHEHGVAELHIIMEENEMELELHIPGADFIGFEYSNLSEEEEKVLKEKIHDIEEQEELLRFRMGLLRRASQVSIEVHEADDEHDEHAEYLVLMKYSYDDASRIKSIDLTKLFELFPSMEEIDWILLSHKGQTAGVVNHSNSRIVFK